jgi:hypothetical protein
MGHHAWLGELKKKKSMSKLPISVRAEIHCAEAVSLYLLEKF